MTAYSESGAVRQQVRGRVSAFVGVIMTALTELHIDVSRRGRILNGRAFITPLIRGVK